MKQHTSRYGYMITNQELVAHKTEIFSGSLDYLAGPFNRGGTFASSQLTMRLKLWYPGMLAAGNNLVNVS
ncbi:hypothetical protein AJ80_01777 [Polytolypa hystricis UAMH7299]|uniref:Uncharacterized protein n=1 Tax=Polytolypa hystricis (strain UAMH7299) TaxID=1447883 RepID=A0A2B7YR24_POLH7|nr:hypothetical protein AJ80_01777 [Polytolypa hystricis UAMH7299]